MHEVTLIAKDPAALWAGIAVSPRAEVRAGVSLLAAGSMAMSRRHELPNRERFFAAAGCPGGVFGLRQVHSQRIVCVTDQSPEELAGIEADGMITMLSTVALSVTIADCLPIFLVDTANGAFGLVHSGWKGTGIVVEALASMRERFGTRPADVAVTIGPGIGACCYRVPEERAEFFGRQFGPGVVTRGPDGTPRLDLRAANVALVREAGVSQIGVVAECTCCSPRLGSFRRQGAQSYTLMCAFLTRASS